MRHVRKCFLFAEPVDVLEGIDSFMEVVCSLIITFSGLPAVVSCPAII